MPSRRASRRIALASAVILVIALPLSIGLLVTHVLSAEDQPESPRTFYVNQNGNDASEGRSRDQPWQTLDRVSNEQLRPGDRVLVAGRVTGTLSILAGEAGDAHNPVVIDSYGGNRASIISDLGIEVRDTSGIAIRNIGIYGAGGGHEKDGINIYATAAIEKRLAGITLENLDISGFVNGIAIGAEGSVGFSNVQVTDSMVHDNRNSGLAIYGPKFDTNHPSYAHDHVVINGVSAYNNSGYRHDEGSNTGNGIVIGSVDTGLIDQSTAYSNGTQAGNTREGPIGIWAYDSTRITIQRSLSYSNRTLGADGDGFGLDQNTTDSVIQYNLSYDNSGAGILLFGQQTDRPNSRNTVRYNISIDDSRNGYHGAISLFGGVDTEGKHGRVTNAQIYQNTVIVNEKDPRTPAILFLGSVDAAVVNNVLSGPLALANRQPGGKVVLRGNNYFSIGDHLIEWDKSTYAGLDDWRRATGSEEANRGSTGIQAEPQLINPATPTSIVRAAQLQSASGFSPGPTSPLPEAGVDLSSVGVIDPAPHDFLGAPVTAAQPGIGAIFRQRSG